MNVPTATILLFVVPLIHHAQLIIFNRTDDDTSNESNDSSREENTKERFVNGSELTFLYWNSILGNDRPIEIEFGKEFSVLDYWIDGFPLKAITHGWLSSDDNCSGVFTIKTAYIDTGGYNVFSVDWSHISKDIIYSTPAILTLSVGIVVAEFFERVVAYTGIYPSDVHLIGHSLGAHVMGSCGSNFKLGKIGRITGLDPARPGFMPIPLQKEHLNKDDGEFVDVIHTSGGTLGCKESLGHVDFHPNSGKAPQPGCGILILDSIMNSHSRSYELYADSVYYRRSLVATQCDSWSDFKSNKCENNIKIFMGHDAGEYTSVRGNFYLKTNGSSPFACFVRSVMRFVQKAVIRWDGFDQKYIQMLSVNDKNVDIQYWNSNLGDDKSIKIKFDHEYKILEHWIPDLPLKVIIHGWLDSIVHKDGVFCIKTAYINVGGYNVITVDWGGIAGNRNYMLPMLMTSKIGARLSKVLDNIVDLGIMNSEDIHLIGHSLGAHIAGVCGSLIKSGKIGRITGLDPAGPGFEFAKLQKKGLKKTDALFVDIIHTSGGSTGIYHSAGHADFFPNGGTVPQSGCYDGMQIERIIGLVGCSHSRAYMLYEDSVYHANSMMAVKCKSWNDYVEEKCYGNTSTPMGHGTSTKVRGDFYLRTKGEAPFDASEIPKEDL